MGWRNTQFNENFEEIYNEDSNIGYLIEADVQYRENLHKFHNDLPLLPERMKIKNIEILVANLHSHKKFKTSVKSQISFEKKCME